MARTSRGQAKSGLQAELDFSARAHATAPEPASAALSPTPRDAAEPEPASPEELLPRPLDEERVKEPECGAEAETDSAVDGLNAPQRGAVGHVEGPLLVFAGAGSGKTRVITYRIANLIAQRIPPYRILAVTFTNKAAGEMRHRLQGIVGEELARDIWVGTFHAICARLLRRHADAAGLKKNFVVYDDADQRAVINRVLKELRISDKRFPPKQLLGRIHKAKQELLGPDEIPLDDYVDEIVAKVYPEYEAKLKAANAVDFDDLIGHVVRIAENPESTAGADLRARFRHVLVDEFQDVNVAQYRLVRALSKEHENLCVVGDDDQSIYRWRGADVRIVRNFRRDLPGARVVKLEQNYRSTAHIVQSALGVIRRASDREPKELWTANDAGDRVAVVGTDSERDEAAFVASRVQEAMRHGVSADEIAIFYRTHAQSRVLEEVLRASRIPHQVIGGMRFFERAEIKDLLSYLRVIDNPESDVDLLRIVNTPSRKIGSTTIERLVAAADGNNTTVYEAIRTVAENGGGVAAQARKALATFHVMMEELRKEATTASPRELAEQVLELSGYAAALKADDRAESEARLQNLQELLGSIEEYENDAAAADELATLSGFLERVTLSSAVDDLEEEARVALMTVHSAKGLEFDVVFITGMEEDIFPFRSQDPTRRGDDEEERRLAYVAITRARKKLIITHTRRRQLFGNTRYNAPSRFLRDLPTEAVESHSTSLAQEMGGSRFVDSDRSSMGRGFGQRSSGRWQHPQASDNGGWARRAAASSPQQEGRYVELDPEFAAPEQVERYVDADVGDDTAGTLRRGARVFHKSFGVGQVMSVDTGPDPTATVHFSGWAPKRIKTRFLKLA